MGWTSKKLQGGAAGIQGVAWLQSSSALLSISRIGRALNGRNAAGTCVRDFIGQY